jgi:hypothetical protein
LSTALRKIIELSSSDPAVRMTIMFMSSVAVPGHADLSISIISLDGDTRIDIAPVALCGRRRRAGARVVVT